MLHAKIKSFNLSVPNKAITTRISNIATISFSLNTFHFPRHISSFCNRNGLCAIDISPQSQESLKTEKIHTIQVDKGLTPREWIWGRGVLHEIL